MTAYGPSYGVWRGVLLASVLTKNELCLGQIIWHVDFDGTMGAGGDWFEVTDFLTELSELMLDRCLWSAVRDEISRHCQSGTVD